MTTTERAGERAVEGMLVGTVIRAKHGQWTVLGTPVYSYPSTYDGHPVYKVAAYYEGRDGTHRAVTLTVHANDLEAA